MMEWKHSVRFSRQYFHDNMQPTDGLRLTHRLTGCSRESTSHRWRRKYDHRVCFVSVFYAGKGVTTAPLVISRKSSEVSEDLLVDWTQVLLSVFVKHVKKHRRWVATFSLGTLKWRAKYIISTSPDCVANRHMDPFPYRMTEKIQWMKSPLWCVA